MKIHKPRVGLQIFHGVFIDSLGIHVTCRNCGLDTLFEIQSTPADYSHVVSGAALLHAIIVTKYVCTNCGYLEQWVNNRDDLTRLKEDQQRERVDEIQ